jgi:hypothetical protein
VDFRRATPSHSSQFFRQPCCQAPRPRPGQETRNHEHLPRDGERVNTTQEEEPTSLAHHTRTAARMMRQLTRKRLPLTTAILLTPLTAPTGLQSRLSPSPSSSAASATPVSATRPPASSGGSVAPRPTVPSPGHFAPESAPISGPKEPLWERKRVTRPRCSRWRLAR